MTDKTLEERGREIAEQHADHSRNSTRNGDGSEPSLLSGMVSAAELDAMVFPPLEEHVPGLVCEGSTIVVGAPKVGKSWFVGNLGLACASGGVALGKIRVKQRPVLYLALEDGHRRLQSRFRELVEGQRLPEALDILTTVQPGTVLPTIAEWLARHHNSRPMVVLDTLGRARPTRPPGSDAYLEDYRIGVRLKELVDVVPGAALVVVHHSRKQQSEDFLDAVSGTQGVAGSFDAVLVISRKRKSREAVLSVTGRDVEESEYGLVIDSGRWTLDGDTLAAAVEAVESRKEQRNLGDRALEVLALVNRRQETRAADLAEIGIDQHQGRTYLSRLADADRITKVGRGVYTGVASVAIVANSSEAQVTPLFGRDTNATPEDASVAFDSAPPTSANSGNATNATDATPSCSDCGTELTTGNQTGLCEECRYIARQQAVANKLGVLGPSLTEREDQ